MADTLFTGDLGLKLAIELCPPASNPPTKLALLDEDFTLNDNTTYASLSGIVADFAGATPINVVFPEEASRDESGRWFRTGSVCTFTCTTAPPSPPVTIYGWMLYAAIDGEKALLVKKYSAAAPDNRPQISNVGDVVQVVPNLRIGNENGMRHRKFISSTTWTCPSGVTSVTCECVGSGGNGAAGETSTTPPATGTKGGGGGGGGAYARSTVTVIPGSGYVVTVGGGNSWFSTTGVAPVNTTEGALAVPGANAATITGGAGGLASSCIGSVKFNGGTGGGAGVGREETPNWYDGGGGGGGSATRGIVGGNGGIHTAIAGGVGGKGNGTSANGDWSGGDGGTGYGPQNGKDGKLGGGGGGGPVNGLGGTGGGGFVFLSWTEL